MAAASSSMAQAVFAARSTTAPFHCTSFLPNLPFLPRSPSNSFTASSKLQISGSKRSLSYCIKASSEDTSETSEVGEVFAGLKEKWDAIENKPMVVIYGGGAAVGVWLAATVVDAINGVPVVSDSLHPAFEKII
ncbi:protein CURVATURE THYLAKOID 1A, chloroplastic-like isoform X2 [Rutidosis leptorrhynchoides]|uniref:protein CURVATURE THYLAKOID 1A, chloroplastic-like isoform X2 n=1 Tax=Rutidosis leptorrhynchoides TaxID=125765 RepID=UPI003A98D51B